MGILQGACRDKSNKTRNGFIISAWEKGVEKAALWNLFSLYVFISENLWYVHLELSSICAQSVG